MFTYARPLRSHGLGAGLSNPTYPTKFTAGPTTAARAANSRFTPSDWMASNISHYNSADASRNESERIRSEAVRLMRERDDKGSCIDNVGSALQFELIT